MNNFGIKGTIYDLFAYFMAGLIFNIVVFVYISLDSNDFVVELNNFASTSLHFIPSFFAYIVFIIISYIEGLLISSISSFFFDNDILKSFCFLRCYFNIKTILTDNSYNSFIKYFLKNFSFSFSQDDFRLVIAFVEENSSNSYGTAFVFLTLYGLNRNLCFIMFLFFILFIDKRLFATLLSLLISFICFYGYIRFYKYFIQQITYSFINIQTNLNYNVHHHHSSIKINR